MILCHSSLLDRSGPFRDVRYESVKEERSFDHFFPFYFAMRMPTSDCSRSRLRFAVRFLGREEKEATRDKKGENDVSDIIRRKLCSKHTRGGERYSFIFLLICRTILFPPSLLSAEFLSHCH